MTRQELITSREYWVGKIHLNLWVSNGSIEADSDKWEEMAEKVVDADFMALLKEVEQSRQAAVSSSARYIIVDESVSAHCCFEYTIIDTAAGKEDYGDYWKSSMCETFDKAEAEIICDALNKHCC